MAEVRADQFSGCLIGQCLGDALGFVVEGYPPADCGDYVGRVLRAGHAGAWGRGQATTDTARRLNEGVAWDEAGTPPPSAGNGSAMRAGPVGLFCFDDPQRLVRVAHDQGRITHRDPRCSAGAVAIAGAVALALTARPIATAPFLRQLADWAGQLDGSVASALRQLEAWLILPPDGAVTHIAIAGTQPEYLGHWHGISPFVTGSVLWSLYAFLLTPDDHWETICTAIAVGGDVDTTAAIPAHLTQHLTDRGTWGFADLVALAEGCYELKR